MKIKLLTIILCVSVMCLCGCAKNETVTIDANVLTINSEILEGNLISRFLSGSSGKLRSGVIKVGVQFEINGNLFLEDLSLSHAQLAYYKDKNILPLEIKIHYSCIRGESKLKFRLNGYYMKKRRVSGKLANDLIAYYRREL